MAIVILTAFFSSLRLVRARWGRPAPVSLVLANSEYEASLREDGELTSRVPGRDYDLSRRSYDFLDPAGRALFLVDAPAGAAGPTRAWPVVGNIAGDLATRHATSARGKA